MTGPVIQTGDGASTGPKSFPPNRDRTATLGHRMTVTGLLLFAFSTSFACAYPALLAIPPWIPGAVPYAVCFWLAVVSGIAGLTVYAISQHRNPAWGLLGMIPLAGPVLGLLTLTPKSQTQEKIGYKHLNYEPLRLGGYVGGLAITAWEISPRWEGAVTWLTTPAEVWSPSLDSCCLDVSLEIPVFVLWGLSFTLTGRTYSSLYKQRVSTATPWLVARTAILGLSLIALLTITLASLAVKNVLDRRAIDALTTLQVGLSRQAVETTIEEANRAILGSKPQDGRSITNEVNEHILNAIRDTRHETHNGERVLVPPKTLSWQFRNALFTCNGIEGHHKVVCRRHYTRGSDPDYGFVLRLTFSDNDTLASARLETSKHQPRGKCRLVSEIPPSERREPSAPCQS